MEFKTYHACSKFVISPGMPSNFITFLLIDFFLYLCGFKVKEGILAKIDLLLLLLKA